jgi:hypothetical protein
MHSGVHVAEEGNRRVGEMTKDEIEQCVLGKSYLFSSLILIFYIIFFVF